MKSGLVTAMQRLNGWRLWLLFSVTTVVAAVLIVSLMDLALMGRITADYVLTGLVTACIVAPASLFLLSALLREIAGQQQRDLSRGVESAEARLQVALDSSDEGVLMVAADGRVLSANKRFFELWRVPAELATAGQDDLLLAHVLDQLSDPDEFMAGVQRLYGSDAQANDTLRFKDGRVFERYTRALDLGAEQGRIWCFRDVSLQAHTREALAEREEQYRAIVNQAADGIDLVDAETLCFLEVNEAACRMLGYRRDELVGQSLAMIQGWRDEAALRDAVAEVMRDGQAGFENQHRCKDGRILDVYVNTRAIRLRGCACLVGVWRDIGERKSADEALRQSRNLLQAIIDTAPMRVFWKDQDLRYLGCNPAFARDAGKTHPDELLGKDDFQMAWAEQAELYRADDRAVMASGVSRLSFDEPQTTPDGRTIWLRTSKVPLRNSDNQTIGILGFYEDITERKLAEIALREREEVFSAVVNRSVEGILLIDAETMEFTEFNDAACEGLGYTREEFARLRLPDVQGSMSAEDTLEKCWVAANTPGGLRFENRHRCKDGSLRDRHVSNRPVQVHGRTCLAHVWHDVTEQKRAAQALAESGLFLRETQSIAHVGGWKANPATDMLLWTEEVYRLVEHPLDSPPSGLEDGLRYYAPEYLPEIKRLLSIAWEQGTPFTFETEMIAASGRRFWAELRCVGRVEAESGVYVTGTFQDITERKRLAAELIQREQYQRALLDNFPFMVWLKDEESRFLAVNEAFAKVFGWPSTESLIGKTDLDIAPAELAELYRADDRAVLQSGTSKQVEELVETDGRRIWFETYKSPVSIGGTVIGTVGFGRDITERKEAERNLKLAVEVAQVILWEMDIPSQQLKFDLNMLPVLGLQPDDDLATFAAWLQRVHPDEAGQFMERFQAAMQPGAVFDLEYRLRSKEGDYRWIHTRGSVIQRRQDGQPEIAVGTSMNITARKLAEAELERYRRHLEELVQQRTTELLATEARATRILESAADGLYGVDSESRITFINPAACRMLGYGAEQAMGRSAHDLFHHSYPDGRPYPAAECLARQAWRAGRESRVDDETYWHADGHAIPVTLASHPIIENGEIIGAVVSIVDTSAQRAAAQARENALAAAESLARARSEFLANMSHEIRTPMNGVLGFAQIGQRNYQNPEKARNAFEKILTSGNQLLGVVNEILDFSKIDAGKLHVEASEMSLGDALDRALELVADRAGAKGLDLRLEKAADLPPSCIGDPLRLGQVLLNLLTNAVKFTEAGSVTLSAALQGGQLVFRVTDTGIGMTPDQLGYVFNPFQQADGSTTRKFGGTGLGLAICKRLVELMQGEIRVESTVGAGSLFEVRLPYIEPAPHPATGHARPVTLPDKPLAGISILLAEDDPINQLMLEVNLEEDGAHLVIVGDGATAVERVIADGPQAYDIVLMDLQMPVMDGYEATRRILELAPGLPIIGQTAHAFDEDREKCLAAGMAAHIAKPIDPQALVTLVLRVLAERRRA
jgi:PAS domain S-box-containing protein